MHYLARTTLSELLAATDKGPDGEDLWLPSGDPACNRGLFNGHDVLIYGPMQIGANEWFELGTDDPDAFSTMSLDYVIPMKTEVRSNAQVRAFYIASGRRVLRSEGRPVAFSPRYVITDRDPFEEFLGGEDRSQAPALADVPDPEPAE